MTRRTPRSSTVIMGALMGLLAHAAAGRAQSVLTAVVPAMTADAEPNPSVIQPRVQPTRPRPAPSGPRRPAFSGKAFAELDWTSFAASKSFDAVLGSSSGTSFGGGARLSHRSGFFGQFDVSRFTKNGERAFAFQTEVFPLGIQTAITMTPVEMSGGYEIRPRPTRPGAAPPRSPAQARRAATRRPGPSRYLPYVGGGIGWVSYTETARFAAAGDDVGAQFQSIHVMGGLDVSVWKKLGVGVDAQKRWVRNALGDAGVSKAFKETDLGGFNLRVRFNVGLGR